MEEPTAPPLRRQSSAEELKAKLLCSKRIKELERQIAKLKDEITQGWLITRTTPAIRYRPAHHTERTQARLAECDETLKNQITALEKELAQARNQLEGKDST